MENYNTWLKKKVFGEFSLQILCAFVELIYHRPAIGGRTQYGDDRALSPNGDGRENRMLSTSKLQHLRPLKDKRKRLSIRDMRKVRICRA